MVTVSCRGLFTRTLAAGMDVPCKRTWVPESKPEPKTCTPGKLHVFVEVGVHVSVACGTKALGTPPLAPAVEPGTMTSEIWADFMGVPEPGLPSLEPPFRLITSILPGWAT